MRKIYTAEMVGSGHPDKFCDAVSDAVLDECLKIDYDARVACEVFATNGLVAIGGEITTKASPDYKAIVQETAREAGYDLAGYELIVAVNEQSPDIAGAVGKGEGAGDQGIMVGYATNETESFMPIEYEYARWIVTELGAYAKSGEIAGIGLDCKTQVSAEFNGGLFKGFTSIIISVQHGGDKNLDELKREINEKIISKIAAEHDLTRTQIHINPSGRFVVGGLDADTGLTGRKIVADSFGSRVPVGGGAFSGKDPTKVDRSGAYYARYAAKNIVATGLAKECQITVSYGIGLAEPLSIEIDCFGTEKVAPTEIEKYLKSNFDFRPANIIKELDLLLPQYKATACYGHFGRDEFAWERVDKKIKITPFISST